MSSPTSTVLQRRGYALLIAVGVVATVTGCGTLNPPSAGAGNFDIAQADSVGLMTVYQDDSHTYLAFSHQVPAATEVYGPQGDRLPAVRAGALIGVTGIFDRLVVRLGGAWAVVSSSTRQQSLPGIPRALWQDHHTVTSQLERLGNANNVAHRLKSNSDRSVRKFAPTAGISQPRIDSPNNTRQVAPLAVSPGSAVETGPNEHTVRFASNVEGPMPRGVIKRIARRAESVPGYVIIRGVVPPQATLRQVNEADALARRVESGLVDAGVPSGKTVITPVRQRWDNHSQDSGAGRVSVSFRPAQAD